MVHGTGSAVIRLCKRFGYMRIDGCPGLLGLFGWRIDNNKLGVHTDKTSSDGNERVLAGRLTCYTLSARQIDPAELAAA